MITKKPLGRKHKLILEIIGFIIIVLTLYVMVKGYAEIIQGESIYGLLFFTIILFYFVFKLSSMGQTGLENIINLIIRRKSNDKR